MTTPIDEEVALEYHLSGEGIEQVTPSSNIPTIDHEFFVGKDPSSALRCVIKSDSARWMNHSDITSGVISNEFFFKSEEDKRRDRANKFMRKWSPVLESNHEHILKAIAHYSKNRETCARKMAHYLRVVNSPAFNDKMLDRKITTLKAVDLDAGLKSITGLTSFMHAVLSVDPNKIVRDENYLVNLIKSTLKNSAAGRFIRTDYDDKNNTVTLEAEWVYEKTWIIVPNEPVPARELGYNKANILSILKGVQNTINQFDAIAKMSDDFLALGHRFGEVIIAGYYTLSDGKPAPHVDKYYQYVSTFSNEYTGVIYDIYNSALYACFDSYTSAALSCVRRILGDAGDE